MRFWKEKEKNNLWWRDFHGFFVLESGPTIIAEVIQKKKRKKERKRKKKWCLFSRKGYFRGQSHLQKQFYFYEKNGEKSTSKNTFFLQKVLFLFDGFSPLFFFFSFFSFSFLFLFSFTLTSMHKHHHHKNKLSHLL